jgi:hypothetical protein
MTAAVWKYLAAVPLQTEQIVTRTLDDGTVETCQASSLAFQAWLADGNLPDPAVSPAHADLVAQARTAALPIRQQALDVLSGLTVDCLVVGNAAGAGLCKAARDRVKDMGTLSLDACPDFEAMRQAYKVEWAAISATFVSQPDLRLQFNKAIK